MIFGLLALIAATIFGGVALYVNIVEQPARLSLDDRSLLAEWKPSYKRGAAMQAPLALVGFLLGMLAWGQTACRLFDRRALDHRAVAMDVDRHQAYQRCAVGYRSRPGRSANTFADPEMGRGSRRTNGFGSARNRGLSVGMPAALVPPI